MEIQELEKRVTEIENRNAKVELDKTWETSITRRLLLIVFTYLAIGIYMYYINIEKPMLNAVIPTLGFYLSTLSLPFIRKAWEKSKKQ